MKYSKAKKDEALLTLRRLLPVGTTVYTKLNHCSRSGMSRSITPLVLVDNEPRYLAYSVGVLFDQQRDRFDGLTIGGYGMDMGFDLVYRLAHRLYPDGFGVEMFKAKVGDTKGKNGKTPATKAEAELLFAHGYRSHGRNGDTSGWDSNGGYALNHRWI